MKNNDWRLYACFVLAIAATKPGGAQQNAAQEFRGELRKQSATFFRGFVVQLDSVTPQGESLRADVQTDGSFEIRNVPSGGYTLRVTNYRGDTIQQQFVNISPQTDSVTVELAEADAARPPAGSVAVGRLEHRPAPKALKAFAAAQKLSGSGKYGQAASKLEEAVRISPDFSEAWTNLAAQNLRLRRFDEATFDAARALEIAGPNSVDLCNLALAQWSARRYPLALESALRGAELDPASDRAQYVAGAILADLNRWREALPHLQYAARTMSAAREALDRAPSSARQTSAH